MVELSDWLTIPEAAARAQTSTRSIERRIEKREIETRRRPRAGKKPETVCHPRDVEKLLPPAHVVSEAPRRVLGHRAPETALQWASPLPLAPIRRQQNDAVAIDAMALRLTEKLWLDLDEACAYSGLGRSVLKRLAKPVGPRGARRIHRKTLEEFAG